MGQIFPNASGLARPAISIGVLMRWLKDSTLDSTLIKSGTFFAATEILLIFAEDSIWRHINLLEWLGLKLVEITDNSRNCQFFLNIKQVAILFISRLKSSETITSRLARLAKILHISESNESSPKTCILLYLFPWITFGIIGFANLYQ